MSLLRRFLRPGSSAAAERGVPDGAGPEGTASTDRLLVAREAPAHGAADASTGRPTAVERPDAVPQGLVVAGAFSWRMLVVVGLLAVVGTLVVLLHDIVVPFLIGLVLSALLVPLADWLRRHGWPGWAAVLTSLVAVLVALGGLASIVTAQVRYDLPSLERRLHATVRSTQDLLASEPFGITTRQLDRWVSEASTAVQAHSGTILSGLGAAGSGVVHALEGLFIVVFTLLFVLIDGPRIWSWVLRVFPRRARPRIDVAGRAGWHTLTAFIRIQLVVAVTDAIGIAGGAALVGVPLAVPIGVVVFLGAFVPVVGAIVAGIFAVAVALVFNGWPQALIVLAIVLLVQQVESHVLHPFLTGSAVKVHPLGVVLGVTAGTTVAGIVGAFFAVPLIATVNAMVVAAARWTPADDEAPSVDHGGVQS